MKLPRNIQAEKGVLGSILIKNDVLIDIPDIIRPSDFSSETHQVIYQAMLDMYFDKQPIDLTTLWNKLQPTVELDIISSLTDEVVSPAMAISHAKVVKTESDKRKVFFLGQSLIQDIKDGKDIKEVIGRATDDIFGLQVEKTKPEHIKTAIKGAISHVEAAYGSGGVVGIPSGLKDLDRVLCGFKPKFYVLAARPGLGKSALAKCISTAAGREGYKILVFSLEMPREELGIRYLSGECRINSRELENGKVKAEGWGKLMRGADSLVNMPIYIDDNPMQTEMDIWGKSRQHKVKHGLDMVIIDYLQLVKCSKDIKTREQEVAHISKTFKAMTMDLSIPVLSLAQLSRECEKQKRQPVLSDLRESGGLEQDSDVTMFLHRPWKYDKNRPRDLVEAIIEKHRGGPTGIVDLNWQEEYTNFYDRERNYDY